MSKEEIQLTEAMVFLRYIWLSGDAMHCVSTTLIKMIQPKHEIIACDRCGTGIECKANSYTKCQCSVVQLSLNEVQYISENYEGCMCAKCLRELQLEYREAMGITN